MQDLQSLFQSSPVAQEVGMGIINQQNQQRDLANRKALQDMLFQREKQPLELEASRVTNQINQARLPQMQAQLEEMLRNNRIGGATESTGIAATNAKNNKVVSDSEDEDIEGMAGKYTQIGAFLENLPPSPAVHAYAKQLLGKHYNPEFDKIPPAALGRALNFIGGELVKNNPKHLQKMAELRQTGENTVNAAGVRAEATTEAARIRAASQQRLADAKAAAANKPGKETIQNLITSLEREAMAETDPERKRFLQEQAEFHTERLRYIRPEQSQAPIIDPGKLPPGTPLKTPEPQVPPTRPGQVDPIANALKKQGKPYEPDKYDYRIDPATGKIQRKPKGQ